jgi:DNA-binding NarL/FixJ family response regulator
VIGTAADARALVRMASVYAPDFVVADIQMPPDHADDGLRAALQIRATRPDIGVLLLSQLLEDNAVALLAARNRKPRPAGDLTARVRLVLALIGEDRSNAGIVQELVVTVSAVERPVISIFDELGLHQPPDEYRRVPAVLKYLRA